MTSKKNMTTNRKPRRIHRDKGGRKKGQKSVSDIILMGRRLLHFMTIIGAQKMNRYIEAGIKAILLLVCTVYVLWVTDTLHIMMGWPY